MKNPKYLIRYRTYPQRNGVDFNGPLLTKRGQLKYAIIAIDYFMKWAEAELLTSITERKATEFI